MWREHNYAAPPHHLVLAAGRNLRSAQVEHLLNQCQIFHVLLLLRRKERAEFESQLSALCSETQVWGDGSCHD